MLTLKHQLTKSQSPWISKTSYSGRNRSSKNWPSEVARKCYSSHNSPKIKSSSPPVLTWPRVSLGNHVMQWSKTLSTKYSTAWLQSSISKSMWTNFSSTIPMAKPSLPSRELSTDKQPISPESGQWTSMLAPEHQYLFKLDQKLSLFAREWLSIAMNSLRAGIKLN